MLTFLESVAGWFWDIIARIATLILPFFSSAQEARSMGKTTRTVLHVLLIIGIVAGLWGLSVYFDMGKYVSARRIGYIHLADFWLSMLFMLTYTLAWLSWWLWKLLKPEDTVEYPDISAAWEEGLQALNQAGLSLTDLPLFLVIGKPEGGELSMFAAAELGLTVKQAPTRPDAPIRLYASRDAVFVTCAGASQLGRHSTLLNDPNSLSPMGSAVAVANGGGAENMFQTMAHAQEQEGRTIQEILAKARAEGRDLTEGEQRRIRQLDLEGKRSANAPQRKAVAQYLKNNPDEAERLSSRLRYLCKLIVRDRRPYAPVNGMMVLLPYVATDFEETATYTGAVAQQDLLTTRHTLQMQCPLFIMVCDMENAPGFREFVSRFPMGERKRRLGQRFPLKPDGVPEANCPDLVESMVQWVCTSLIPTWVYKRFQQEENREEFPVIVRGNAAIYTLLGEMIERRKRFAGLIRRTLTVEGKVPWWFGGCYIAATGSNPAQDQAFIAGVFRRLFDHVNSVSWTPEAINEDKGYNRWATTGFVIMAVIVLSPVLYFLRGIFQSLVSGS